MPRWQHARNGCGGSVLGVLLIRLRFRLRGCVPLFSKPGIWTISGEMFHRLLIEKDVPIPLRDGGDVFANVFRPAEDGHVPGRS